MIGDKITERILARGEPPEPTLESPGTLLAIVSKFIDEVKATDGKEPPALEAVLVLAHTLDLQHHEQEVRAFRNLKRMAERAKSSGLIVPGGGE